MFAKGTALFDLSTTIPLTFVWEKRKLVVANKKNRRSIMLFFIIKKTSSNLAF
jgi:hypothetical protein